jgi:hypothetical protein
MAKTKKISFNVDTDLFAAVMNTRRPGPTDNLTFMFTQALHDGIELRHEVERLRRLNELATLKILFILRKIAAQRGEALVKEIDSEFPRKREDMLRLIMDEGMDYGEF